MIVKINFLFQLSFLNIYKAYLRIEIKKNKECNKI